MSLFLLFKKVIELSCRTSQKDKITYVLGRKGKIVLPLAFTLEGANQFSEAGCIEEWVHLFLKTVGNNISFSEGLKLQKRYWRGPIQLPLAKLQRCCGPEEGMTYHNPLEEWEIRVGKLYGLLQEGWQYPPLIAQHIEGKLIINDGNGRHEALRRLNYTSCWAVVWGSDDDSNLNKY